MNKEAIAELIKQTVEASPNGDADYTLLASIIITVVGLFIWFSRYQAKQIMKHQDGSAKERKALLEKIHSSVGTHELKINEHDIKIAYHEKQIHALWEEKEPKRAT